MSLALLWGYPSEPVLQARADNGHRCRGTVGAGALIQHQIFSTPKEVVDEVKRRIDDLAPGGGFVFSPIHNVQTGVPPENVVAMFRPRGSTACTIAWRGDGGR